MTHDMLTDYKRTKDLLYTCNSVKYSDGVTGGLFDPLNVRIVDINS